LRFAATSITSPVRPTSARKTHSAGFVRFVSFIGVPAGAVVKEHQAAVVREEDHGRGVVDASRGMFPPDPGLRVVYRARRTA